MLTLFKRKPVSVFFVVFIVVDVVVQAASLLAFFFPVCFIT